MLLTELNKRRPNTMIRMTRKHISSLFTVHILVWMTTEGKVRSTIFSVVFSKAYNGTKLLRSFKSLVGEAKEMVQSAVFYYCTRWCMKNHGVTLRALNCTVRENDFLLLIFVRSTLEPTYQQRFLGLLSSCCFFHDSMDQSEERINVRISLLEKYSFFAWIVDFSALPGDLLISQTKCIFWICSWYYIIWKNVDWYWKQFKNFNCKTFWGLRYSEDVMSQFLGIIFTWRV